MVVKDPKKGLGMMPFSASNDHYRAMGWYRLRGDSGREVGSSYFSLLQGGPNQDSLIG